MLRTLLLSLVALSLLQCTGSANKEEKLSLESDFNSVDIDGNFRMMIPKYMKEADNLNDDASLQYQNIFKETYVVVIDEPKDEFISVFQELGEFDDSLSIVENYRTIQMGYMEEGINIQSVTEPVAININGLSAEVVELDGTVEGVVKPISYFFIFVEGPDNVYMIMAWTLKDRKQRFKDTFQKMYNSFQVIS